MGLLQVWGENAKVLWFSEQLLRSGHQLPRACGVFRILLILSVFRGCFSYLGVGSGSVEGRPSLQAFCFRLKLSGVSKGRDPCVTKPCTGSTPRSALPHLLPPLQSKTTLLKSPLVFVTASVGSGTLMAGLNKCPELLRNAWL